MPLDDQGKFDGVIMGEYSIDGLLRFGVPTEVTAKYAVTVRATAHNTRSIHVKLSDGDATSPSARASTRGVRGVRLIDSNVVAIVQAT